MADDKDNLQALLDALNAPVTSVRPVDPNIPFNEVKRFIDALNVRSGERTWIHTSTVYDAFLTWTKKPISQRLFTRFFNQYFKPKKSTYNTVYNLMPDSFGLPEDYSIYKDPVFNRMKNVQPRDEYLGVYTYPNGNIVARITMPDGKSRYLGKWPSLKQAAIAYDKMAIELYGETAVVNFPMKWNKKAKDEKED